MARRLGEMARLAGIWKAHRYCEESPSSLLDQDWTPVGHPGAHPAPLDLAIQQGGARAEHTQWVGEVRWSLDAVRRPLVIFGRRQRGHHAIASPPLAMARGAVGRVETGAVTKCEGRNPRGLGQMPQSVEPRGGNVAGNLALDPSQAALRT